MATLRPFERAPWLAVAVSGGPDSLALTLLAARWARQMGGTVHGLTVDHGLRPESAAEAGQVVAWLRAHGIVCRVLTWTGPKPATGVQAAARSARCALLAAACREAGILHLLLAHHELDQAETACMRAERGSGQRGLAGMAAVSERAGLRLLRPLLSFAPERLRATLEAAAQPWLDDPGNVAQRFRRARLRSEKDFDRTGWLAAASAAAALRAEGDHAVARFAAAAVTPSPLGYLTLALGPWRELPDEVAELVLARCILAVSGQPYTPPAASITRLAQKLRHCLQEPGASLGGTLLLHRKHQLLVVREPGRIRDRRELAAGTELFWDGRFAIRYHAGPETVLAAAVGTVGQALLRAEFRHARHEWRPPPAALLALPGLWHDGAILASPLHVADGIRAEFVLRPANPVATAPFAGPNVV
jgi:tRNA(Ile)-lysidine synthase